MSEPSCSVCVFCGSKTGNASHWMALADEVGAVLARRGARVVYGGGGVGLMGAVAGAALRERGQVIGVIPHALMSQELGKHEVTRLERVDSMAERKVRMMALSDAFLILPGGLGTLDEWFEVMTLRQIGEHKKPIAIINSQGYFNGVLQAMNDFAQAGFVKRDDLDYMLAGDQASTVIDQLLAAVEK